MPIPVPRSAREAWGPEVADDVANWADEVRDQAVSRDEFRKVISRLDRVENEMEVRFANVEERLGRIEDRLTQMDARFDAIHAQMNERFDAMNERLDERSDRIDEKLGQMNDRIDEKLGQMNDRILSMTRWLIGLVALFGTMVTVLLAVAQYTAG
jgi:tetrahydromethanopterin S-methyltransferase subunit G